MYRKINIFGSILIITLTTLFLACDKGDNRFELKADKSGKTYKLDKQTGQITLLQGERETPVAGIGESEINDAMNLTKNADMRDVWYDDWKVMMDRFEREPADTDIYAEFRKDARRRILYGMSIGDCIDSIVKNQKGNFTILGWGAEKVDSGTYLVTYTIKRNGSDTGWLFEVSIPGKLVRDPTLDPELAKKYGLQYRGSTSSTTEVSR